MSLSIDFLKVETELKKSPRQYVVSPCNFHMAQEPSLIIPLIDKGSTLSGPSLELESFRRKVRALRQQIAERGEQVAKSAEDLERIADEMRGRA
jgi:hypothetical protein